MFRAELMKLRRSSVWLIVVILPLLAVVTGAVNFANNPDQLDSGWSSLTSQITLFYGLLFFSSGIGLLAATVWRMENRGSNWNLLLTATVRPVHLVVAKAAAISVLVACMQVVLVGGTLAAGEFVLHLEGSVPWQFLLVGAISVVAALPLVTIQSLLSMLLRSFAAPVALCLVGCVAGVAMVTSSALRPLSYVWPQAIITRSLNLGSSALADSGNLTVSDAMPILVVAVLGAGAVAVLSVVLLRAIKLR